MPPLALEEEIRLFRRGERWKRTSIALYGIVAVLLVVLVIVCR